MVYFVEFYCHILLHNILIAPKFEKKYLEDYVKLCSLEWGSPKSDDEVKEKVSSILYRLFMTGGVNYF